MAIRSIDRLSRSAFDQWCTDGYAIIAGTLDERNLRGNAMANDEIGRITSGELERRSRMEAE